jgi:hypothetical protein
MIVRAASGLLMLGTVAACAPAESDFLPILIPLPMDMDCGFNASKDYRRTQEERANPPACALPSAEFLARQCAAHDVTMAPGFVPDKEDETGEVINPTPLPNYRVDDLACAFDDEGRNRATCRFTLTVPGGAPAKTAVRLRHVSYGRITPLIYEQGVIWSLGDDCTPAVPTP